MSKYQEHFRKANSTAKAAFMAYRKAEKAYQDAEAMYRKYPERMGMVDAEYAARAARAKADFLEAKEALTAAKRTLSGQADEMKGIRKALAADIAAANIASPDSMDMPTIELLKSGILTGGEYMNLLQKYANNPTMTRIIGKYAQDAAEARGKVPGDTEATNLRIASYQARTNTGEEVLQNFDVVCDAFNRSANNPAMIDHWDSLTGEIMQAYGANVEG